MGRMSIVCRLSVLAAILTAQAGFSQQLEEVNGTVQPHATHFGIKIPDEACSWRDKKAELQAMGDYASLPYSFTGPTESCHAFGCDTDYWGSRCRFKGHYLPACPLETRWKIVHALNYHYRQLGSAWAGNTLSLKPCDLWPQLRGRTLWIIGDSLTQDFMTSLVCFMVEYMVPKDLALTDDESIKAKLSRNTRGRDMPSWCFAMPGNTRICAIRSNKAPRMVRTVLPILTQLVDREKDILIMNFGTWYNRVWHQEELSELEYDTLEFEVAFNQLRDRLPKRVFWRESTAQHFDTLSGVFDPLRPVAEQRCARPGAGMGVNLTLGPDRAIVRTHGYASSILEFEALLHGGERNLITQPVMDRLGIRTLRMYNMSLLFDDVHHDYHIKTDGNGGCALVPCDCSHACLPSWYQLTFADFNEALKTEDWDAPAIPKITVVPPHWVPRHVHNRSRLQYRSDDDIWLDLN